MKKAHGFALPLAALSLFSLATRVLAVTPPDAGRAYESVGPAPLETAPPRPAPQLGVIPARPAMVAADGTRIPVNGFRITGARALPADTLAGLLADLQGKRLTVAEINRGLARIQDAYAAQGYFLAQAYLPEQDIRDGIVEVAILEGRLGQVQVQLADGARIREGTVQAMVAAASPVGDAVHQDQLERGLLLLNDYPGVEMKSTLVPGATVGTADLRVELKDGPLVSGSVEADNFGNKYTGRGRLGGQVNLNNATGLGDQASLRVLSSFDGLDYWRLGYFIPVGDYGTKVGLSYADTQYHLCCDFAPLKAKGDAQVWSGYVLHPIQRSRAFNLYGSLTYDDKSFKNKTVAGTTSDKTNRVWTLGFSGDARDGLLGGGLSIFGANFSAGRVDLDGWGPDRQLDAATERKHGSYAKTGYNLGRLQSLTPELSFYLALSGQFASRNLDSSEKFVLGGISGVRAYAQGEATGDEGHLLNAELRWDLPGSYAGSPLQLVGFVDTGRITLHKHTWSGWQGGNGSLPNHYSLSGFGVGINWGDPRDLSVRASFAQTLGSNPGRDINGRDSENGHDRHRLWVRVVKNF